MARRAVSGRRWANYAATAAAFCAGTPVSPWIGNWVARNKKWIALYFAGGLLGVQRSGGQQHLAQSRLGSLLFIVVVSLILLAIVIAINVLSPVNAFNKTDNHYCFLRFSSTANGIPMSTYSVPTSVLGMMVLPLMIFPQIQLMVCAGLARRYKRRTEVTGAAEENRAAESKRAFRGCTSCVSPRF